MRRLFLVRGSQDGIRFGREPQDELDVEFAAHARIDVPDLLAEVKAKEAARAQWAETAAVAIAARDQLRKLLQTYCDEGVKQFQEIATLKADEQRWQAGCKVAEAERDSLRVQNRRLCTVIDGLKAERNKLVSRLMAEKSNA